MAHDTTTEPKEAAMPTTRLLSWVTFSASPDHPDVPAWCVSFETGGVFGPGRIKLNVHRFWADQPNQWGGVGVTERHPFADGLRFDTEADARAEAVAWGLTVPYHRHDLELRVARARERGAA